jgi:hypothetical protein
MNDSLPGPAAPEDIPQMRPLIGDEREVLHRVLGMLEDKPGYAALVGPGLQAAIGDGTRPQERHLTGRERAGLGDIIRRLIGEWESPRLPWEQPSPAWDLSGADIARLGLILRAVSPPPDNPGRPLFVRLIGPRRPRSPTTG